MSVCALEETEVGSVRETLVKENVFFNTSQSLKFHFTTMRTGTEEITHKVVFHGKPKDQAELWEKFPRSRAIALAFGDFDKAEKSEVSFFCSGRHRLKAI